MVPKVPLEKWKVLYEAALQFRDQKLWDWMDNGDLFGIVNPKKDETGYVCITGGLGEHLGMGLYLGKNGLRSYNMLIESQEMGDNSEAMFIQDCLMVSFEKKASLDKEDKEIIKALGYTDFGKGMNYPVFRRFEPGYFPWFLNKDEVDFLTTALLQTLEVAENFRKNPKLLQPEAGSEALMLHWQPVFSGKTLKGWEKEWRKPENVIEFRPHRAKSEPLRAASLKRDVKQKPAYWLFEQFYWPKPIQNSPGERPFFPKALLLFELESQQVISCELVSNQNLNDELGIKLEESFRAQKIRPSNIIVSKMENYHLLRELCSAWEIELHLDDQLDILEDLKENFLNDMT